MSSLCAILKTGLSPCLPSPFQDTTTCAVAPVHMADGAPVVKLPGQTNYISQHLLLVDNIPCLRGHARIDGVSPVLIRCRAIRAIDHLYCACAY
jgi:hypothetical protein